MITTEIKVYTSKEMQEVTKKLTCTGYLKISDCMWAKIFRKGNNEILVARTF